MPPPSPGPAPIPEAAVAPPQPVPSCTSGMPPRSPSPAPHTSPPQPSTALGQGSVLPSTYYGSSALSPLQPGMAPSPFATLAYPGAPAVEEETPKQHGHKRAVSFGQQVEPRSNSVANLLVQFLSRPSAAAAHAADAAPPSSPQDSIASKAQIGHLTSPPSH